jgi:putative holliday junction resolvase
MRILAIDYGIKRCGIAATDPLRIIASPIDTIDTPQIFDFLKLYTAAEAVAIIVVGEPKHLDGSPAQIAEKITLFCTQLALAFPDILVERYDERFTSKIAAQRILAIGVKKKDRRDKGLTDRLSAVVILEDYCTSKGIFS